MSVVFEFEAGKEFHFSTAFGQQFQMPVENDRVYLAKELGNGFIQEVYLNNGLTLCIHNYILQQPLVLKRRATDSAELLAMKFDGRRISIRSTGVPDDSIFSDDKECDVEFGTSNFFTELTVPAHQPVILLVIGITRQNLMDLLQLYQDGSSVIYTLQNNPSFVIHESMTQEMERTLVQVSQIDQTTRLAVLRYQIKAQELIYQLFSKLVSRTDNVALTIHPADAETIYAIRSAILADLSITPQLPELAAKFGMGLSKMKQLFHQIFGSSIYTYYQTARMTKAANLLAHFSVSETGYHVGFTNLSHFGRLFERHHQMKPKRFKDTLKARAKNILPPLH
jgi:AraC-like DNA-binding protein